MTHRHRTLEQLRRHSWLIGGVVFLCSLSWSYVSLGEGCPCFLPVNLAQAQNKSDEQLAQLMKRKMEAAQKILEGLALAQFDTIVTNAETLIFISRQASFRVLPTPEYELHSNEFRRIAGELASRAREKNLDGATLHYMDLTLTCVKCHKHVRDRRGTFRDNPSELNALAGQTDFLPRIP